MKLLRNDRKTGILGYQKKNRERVSGGGGGVGLGGMKLMSQWVPRVARYRQPILKSGRWESEKLGERESGPITAGRTVNVANRHHISLECRQ